MKDQSINIQLLPQELNYLKNATFLSPTEIALLNHIELQTAQYAILAIPKGTAEYFREKFTEQLAKIGFNKNYEITPEGAILETLIDRFHVK